MITCQSRPLEPFADCPLPRCGPSAIQTLRTLRETASLGKLKVEGRTISPLLRANHQNLQGFCPRKFSRRRTVRPQEPDRPQYNLDTQDRTTKFLRPFQVLKADHPPPRTGQSAVHFGPPSRAKNGSVRAQTRQQRTVHPPRADRPQVHFQQKYTSVKRP